MARDAPPARGLTDRVQLYGVVLSRSRWLAISAAIYIAFLLVVWLPWGEPIALWIQLVVTVAGAAAITWDWHRAVLAEPGPAAALSPNADGTYGRRP